MRLRVSGTVLTRGTAATACRLPPAVSVLPTCVSPRAVSRGRASVSIIESRAPQSNLVIDLNVTERDVRGLASMRTSETHTPRAAGRGRANHATGSLLAQIWQVEGRLAVVETTWL